MVARELAALRRSLLSNGENYPRARPALLTRKIRLLELCARLQSRRELNGTGASHGYNLPERRA